MSTQIQEINFTPEQRKALASQLGDVINTEISIMEPIMKAYSNSPYFQSKLENITNAGIKQRLFDFCNHFGYVGLNMILIFDKAPISSYMLENPHYIGTTMNVHFAGNRTDIGMSDVNIEDRIIKVDVQPEKWEEAGIITLNGGPYTAIIIQNAYAFVEIEDEPSKVVDESENSMSESEVSESEPEDDIADEVSESENDADDEISTYDLLLSDLLKKGKE